MTPASLYQERVRRKKQKLIYDHKAARGCELCGEADPVVLELDHRDPAEKSHHLSRRVYGHRGYSFVWTRLSYARIAAELEKCRVLCANCHKRITAQQGNWYHWLEDFSAIDERRHNGERRWHGKERLVNP